MDYGFALTGRLEKNYQNKRVILSETDVNMVSTCQGVKRCQEVHSEDKQGNKLLVLENYVLDEFYPLRSILAGKARFWTD